MTTSLKTESGTRTQIGWQGLRFTLPPEWNLTGFSMDPANGYLKIDSGGTMFAQVKWSDPQAKGAGTTGEWLSRLWQKILRRQAAPPPPDLRAILDNFLAETEKQARKAKGTFDCKVKPETLEAGEQRLAHNFQWSGGGHGQGKIWHCRVCGRVVIAQVVGQARDNVASVAAEMFGSLRDHPENGWTTWGLFDLVAAVPEEFVLKRQKMMSGHLQLEFERRGGERLVLDRWGLANVIAKKFTLKEWLLQLSKMHDPRAALSETTAQSHPAVYADGRVRGALARLSALRAAGLRRRPATCYEACCWECPQTNKLFAVQWWHAAQAPNVLEEMVSRCECH